MWDCLVGLLQECSVHQDRPTPFYVDSGSAVAAAQNRSAPKRSIWLQRRTLVFHEGVEQKEIEPTHISERDNVSDPNTTYYYTVKEDYSNSLKLELGFDLNLIDSWYFSTSIRRLIKNNKDFENEFAIKVSKPF